jgi:hypothetical protein
MRTQQAGRVQGQASAWGKPLKPDRYGLARPLVVFIEEFAAFI